MNSHVKKEDLNQLICDLFFSEDEFECTIFSKHEYDRQKRFNDVKFLVKQSGGIVVLVDTSRHFKAKVDGKIKTIHTWPQGINNIRGVTGHVYVEEDAFTGENFNKIIVPLLKY